MHSSSCSRSPSLPNLLLQQDLTQSRQLPTLTIKSSCEIPLEMSYDRYGDDGGRERDDYRGQQGQGYGGGQDDYNQSSGGYGEPRRHGQEGMGQGGYGGNDQYQSGGAGGAVGYGEPRRHQQEGGFGGFSGGNQGDYQSGGAGGYGEPGRRHEGGGLGGFAGGNDYQSGSGDQYGSEQRQHGGRRYGDEGSGYGGGSVGNYGEDHTDTINHALKHSGGEDSGVFASAMGFLGQNKHNIHNEGMDEQMMMGAHQQLYGGAGSNRPPDSDTLGAGAAMQALKMFSGGGAGQQGMGSQGGGNSQNQFVGTVPLSPYVAHFGMILTMGKGMAMANASKLFDQQQSQGNVASGVDKNSAVQSAAKMALKMYMSSGQGGGGGAGGLMVSPLPWLLSS